MRLVSAVAAGMALAGCGFGTMVREAQARRDADERACAAGEAAVCLRLGQQDLDRFRRPGGIESGKPAARSRALAWFERACSLGLAAGCLAAADLSAPDAPAKVPALAARACQLDLATCAEAAALAVPHDPIVAEKLAEQACVPTAAPACLSAARLPFPRATADRLHARACHLGAGAACTTLARVQETDRPLEAERWYRLGCVTGEHESCFRLGRLLTAHPERPLGGKPPSR